MRLPNGVDVALWKHQIALIASIAAHATCELFFMVAGYGSGKSFSGVILMLTLALKYEGQHVVIGIGGGTITMLRKTMLADFERLCIIWGISYEDNRQEGIIRVGTVMFVIIATENPNRIYAYNFSAFICDEIDELPQHKALDVFTAVQERVRIEFPDGRAPFSAFMTTAQGLKGMYQIVTEATDKGMENVLIRGETRDNKSLSPLYYQRLYRMYNEMERMVFLFGHFGNLTAGRVYAEYNEESCRRGVRPFPIGVGDIVQVGQDLNLGFSRGSAIVKRGGVLYVPRVWSFPVIGRAPGIIRSSFPQSEINWYPDASGKEIIAGYAAEVRQADIRTRIGTVNPSVVDRVFIVNKLFATGRLKLFDVPETSALSMALKVRQYNDAGDPEKGKGPEAPDHYCFPAGTMVATGQGERPIESICAGDEVFTRKGLRRVSAAGQTGYETVSSYRGLVCTGNHPVWTGEWKRADLLTDSDTLCRIRTWELRQCENIIRLQSLLRKWCTDVTPRQRRSPTGSTTDAQCEKVWSDTFTARSGKRPTARFRPLMTFITSTVIRSITLLKIFGLSLRRNIEYGTGRALQPLLQNLLLAILRRPVRRQRFGIVVKKAARGIANMVAGLYDAFSRSIASVAVSLSDPSCAMHFSALAAAFQGIGEHPVSTTSNVSARGAIAHSWSTDSPRHSIAPNPAPPVPVFNLTVEGEHEYFAGGVLVSNCDGLEYAIWRIVSSDRDFFDIWQATRTGRAEQRGKKAA